MIGARPLHDLSAGDVRSALGELVTRYSTRSLQITRNSLERAIRHAEANDLVGRNVAALVKPPRGRSGRPSKSFTLEQAKALLATAERTRWHAYVALSLLVGIRTEEARALRWDHVVTWVDDAGGWQPVTTAGFEAAKAGDDRFAIYVWRSERYDGDTKTEKSRRTLALLIPGLAQRLGHALDVGPGRRPSRGAGLGYRRSGSVGSAAGPGGHRDYLLGELSQSTAEPAGFRTCRRMRAVRRRPVIPRIAGRRRCSGGQATSAEGWSPRRCRRRRRRCPWRRRAS